MNETNEEENVKLTVTETATTNNTLSSDDLIALTELIQQESSSTNSFNYHGIIVGSTLLGAGLLCSLGTVLSCHPKFNTYKHRTTVNQLCSVLAIPLTTTGLAMTSLFILNKKKRALP